MTRLAIIFSLELQRTKCNALTSRLKSFHFRERSGRSIVSHISAISAIIEHNDWRRAGDNNPGSTATAIVAAHSRKYN